MGELCRPDGGTLRAGRGRFFVGSSSCKGSRARRYVATRRPDVILVSTLELTHTDATASGLRWSRQMLVMATWRARRAMWCWKSACSACLTGLPMKKRIFWALLMALNDGECSVRPEGRCDSWMCDRLTFVVRCDSALDSAVKSSCPS